MNSRSRCATNLGLISLLLMLSACATDNHFGDAVRAMKSAQVYDKSAALDPVTEPVPQDGQKAQIVIDTFWEVGRQQKQIHNSIDINVGN